MDDELTHEYGPKWSDQRVERMLGALVCAVVALLLALIVTVFVHAWPSFAHNGLAWFVAGDHFREDGWRDMSRSRATRAFAKLGWTGVDSDLALSGAFADTDLNGNGLQEMRLLAADRDSIYVIEPDGRVFVQGVALWNRSEAQVLAPGAVIYVPLRERAARKVDATMNSDIAAFLATQVLPGPGAP